MEQKRRSLMNIVADNIKKIRMDKGLTIEELSNLTGYSKNFLLKNESSQAKRVFLSHICTISKVLNIKIENIFEGN